MMEFSYPNGLERILQAPKRRGRIELMVRRPEVGEREVLVEAEFCVV